MASKTKSQRALIQMTLVLIVVIAADIILGLWKMDTLREVMLADWRTVVFNAVIILIFLLGVGQLYRGLIHYTEEEKQLSRYLQLKAEGLDNEQIFTEIGSSSLIARRYFTIRELYRRGVPINHGAIAAIMTAEESLYQSFPRFVNNVLILTGVFGTVSSLIFALVGASNVLQTTLPGEGMGLMLLGMNTALTTTATAILCYFIFTYFYQKLTDVQTYLLSQIEGAVLIHIIPDFAFDQETLNHETKHLVNEVRGLVGELHAGVGNIERSLAGLNDHNEVQLQKWNSVLSAQESLIGQITSLMTRVEEVRRVLVEGFRLK